MVGRFLRILRLAPCNLTESRCRFLCAVYGNPQSLPDLLEEKVEWIVDKRIIFITSQPYGPQKD